MIKDVNVLGTKYYIYFLPENEMQIEDADGYCERWSKEIFINEDAFNPNQPDIAKDVHLAKNKVIRHELIHAVFHEAGLRDYCEDETLIDALAILVPKMCKIFKQLEIEE